MKEKGTSILIETKDQRKEEREKREKQENWRERDITKARSKNTFVAARRIRRGGGFLFFWFSLVFSGFLLVFFWFSFVFSGFSFVFSGFSFVFFGFSYSFKPKKTKENYKKTKENYKKRHPRKPTSAAGSTCSCRTPSCHSRCVAWLPHTKSQAPSSP